MTTLTKFDPISLNRAFIGLDRLFDHFDKQFFQQVQTNYPPFNVIKVGNIGDDMLSDRLIEVAVTGFSKDEITVEEANRTLIIRATKAEDSDDSDEVYLHHGLATRDFERRFALLENMEVSNVTLANGLLSVYIKHVVPEELKPRRLEIK